MKFNLFKLYFAILFVNVFLFGSCSEDDTKASETVNFSSEDSLRASKTDNIAEGTFNIIEQGFVENESEGRGQSFVSVFSDCTEITVGIQGNGFTILLDFGSSCTLNNGAIVSGSIFLEYGPLQNGTYTINYTLQDFTYNGNGVSGGGTILYEIANQNGNPQSTLNESINVSFPNTTVTATRNGIRISEWVAGVGSGTWVDNVHHITGNWQTEFTNGFERSGLVTETLVRKLACPYLVSGVLEVTQDGVTSAIDFGDGECDNQAVFIYNGQEYPFTMN